MADRDMVIKSIENCLHKKECDDCSYEGCIHAHGNCIDDLMAQATERITFLETALDFATVMAKGVKQDDRT